MKSNKIAPSAGRCKGIKKKKSISELINLIVSVSYISSVVISALIFIAIAIGIKDNDTTTSDQYLPVMEYIIGE